jgi:putative transposase
MRAAEALSESVGASPACRALGVPRAGLYRRRRPREIITKTPRPMPGNALAPQERQAVLDTLRSERFMDQAPTEVYATLLDEASYLCSIRTMYRVLDEQDEVRERRNQARHPDYKKPELLATGPNQVWSWDITKLRGAVKWSYFHLYVILDIFSRYVVGWMVSTHESAALAERLITESISKHGIGRNQLTLHADRGSSMKSKTVTQLLADLGVAKSHSRPHVSDDNPYSESQFKTMKYCPEFPDRFGSIEDARVFCRRFFPWYNDEHHHTGIGLLTPEAVHFGRAKEVIEKRRIVLEAAYRKHPERFFNGPPKSQEMPSAAWINKPDQESRIETPEVAIAQL